MSKLLKREGGFTLIEVVLVLAIGSMLIMVVFMAASGAQKSRRDSQRKQDNARFMAQAETFASNNAGNYSTMASGFGQSGTYAISNWTDPTSGAVYVTTNGAVPAAGCPIGRIYFTPAARSLTSNMCLENGGYQTLTNR